MVKPKTMGFFKKLFKCGGPDRDREKTIARGDMGKKVKEKEKKNSYKPKTSYQK